MFLQKVVLLIGLLTETTHSASYKESAQQRLVRILLTGYDKDLRPVWDTRSMINVTTNPALHSIVATDDASESITIVLWFRMLWNDVFLQWNPDDYDGLDELLLPMERIWYPDLTIHNMISVESLVPDDKNYAIIDYHGNVLISNAQLITFNCKYRIADFPFDTQNCSLHVVSWMHNAAQMDIFAMMPTDLGPYKTNAEWNLLSVDSRRKYSYYAASKTPFVDVYYDVIIQRKPGYYLTTFFVPSFIITTLAIVGIFGPFNDSGDREEKVTMGLTTLLTMAVILLLVTGQIPKSSGSMPLLGLFIILEIALSACASLTSVFVMFQHGRWTKGHPIPKWIVMVTWMHGDGAQNENNRHEAKAAESDSTLPARNDTDTIIDRLIVHDLRSMLTPVNIALDSHNQEEALRMKWTRVTRRLDVIFALLFNLLHVILMATILAYGSSKYREASNMKLLQ